MQKQSQKRRLIAEKTIIKRVRQAMKGLKHTDAQEEDVVRRIIDGCKVTTHEGQILCDYDHFYLFLDNLSKSIEHKDFTVLGRPRGQRFRPVDVQEFVESPNYMAQKGYCWPAMMESLWEIFHGKNEDGSDHYYIEVVLGGATTAGKNYRAEMSMAYLLYLLSSYYSPQVEFGLAPGSPIVFIMQSKKLDLATRVIFKPFMDRIALSPYFQKNFMYDVKLKSEMRFPNQISVYPAGGEISAAIGMNLWAALCDELNFMLRTRDSVHLQFTGEEEWDQAEKIYNHAIRRIKGRFQRHGKVPGKIFLISSANYEGDFIDRKSKEAATDRTIYCDIRAQWEAIPADQFSPEKFLVELGTDTRRSRILQSRELAYGDSRIIEVPVDYRGEFEKDIDGALKDLAGIAIGSSSPMIPYRELIEEAQVKHELLFSGKSLFLQPDFILSETTFDPGFDNWDILVNHDYIEEHFVEGTAFACHLDMGLSGDAFGICIGHISGYRQTEAMKQWDDATQEFKEIKDAYAPEYVIDGALRLRSAYGQEIDFNVAVSLILYIHQFLPLKWGTADSYQSVMFLQKLKAVHIRSGTLSVDANLAPYLELKEAFKDGRIAFPRHDWLAQELRELQRVVINGKVKAEHPSQGSKDIADSLAGVVFMLHSKEAKMSQGRLSRPSRTHSHIARPSGGRRIRILGGRDSSDK